MCVSVGGILKVMRSLMTISASHQAKRDKVSMKYLTIERWETRKGSRENNEGKDGKWQKERTRMRENNIHK